MESGNCPSPEFTPASPSPATAPATLWSTHTAPTTEDNLRLSPFSIKESFLSLTLSFKKYKSHLLVALKAHVDTHSFRVTSRAVRRIRKALTSIHELLTANINHLRLDPSPLEIVAIGARLAAVKEGFFYVEARLNDFEDVDHTLDTMFLRLGWRQARHEMLTTIYGNANSADAYETLDVHALTAGWVQLPKIYTVAKFKFVEDQDWPEEMENFDSDAACPICKLQLNEDPDAIIEEGTFAIVPAACCRQPFHSSCSMAWLKERDDGHACPHCRDPWSAGAVAGKIAMTIAQMEDLERMFRSMSDRRRRVET